MALVRYEAEGPIATVTLDDGKVNVMSPAMQEAIHGALDRAEAAGSVVLLAGREGVFSAGFDLQVLRAGGSAALDMVQGGFELAARVLAFPTPVAIACTGHAIAMGAFLLLSGDYRVGARGAFKLTANEVAIGLTMPYPAAAILRHRLTPAAFNRAVTVAAPFTMADGVGCGFVDEVVEAVAVGARTQEIAATMATLDFAAHAASKQRIRAELLEEIRVGIERDRAELVSR